MGTGSQCCLSSLWIEIFMPMQYFQTRTLRCLQASRYHTETTSQFLSSPSSSYSSSSWSLGIYDALGTRLCILPVFSQLMHATKKVILTLLRRKQAYRRPPYHLGDYPVCSVIIVGTKVIFHCANPWKNLDKKWLPYMFGQKPGVNGWFFIKSERRRKREKKWWEKDKKGERHVNSHNNALEVREWEKNGSCAVSYTACTLSIRGNEFQLAVLETDVCWCVCDHLIWEKGTLLKRDRNKTYNLCFLSHP